MKEIHINSAILDIEKINGKDVLSIEQVDNDGKGINYIYINNFRIQDWRKKINDGELLTRSNHENTN
jgi:hypothetical protein